MEPTTDVRLRYPGKDRRLVGLLRYDHSKPRRRWQVATAAHDLDRWLVRRTGWSLICWLFQPRSEHHPVEPAVLLGHTGARSGRRRQTVLSAFADGPDSQLIVGSNGARPNDPAWVLNLRADPHCTLWYRRRSYPAVAEELTGPDRERARAFIIERHPAFPPYEAKAATAGRTMSIWRLRPETTAHDLTARIERLEAEREIVRTLYAYGHAIDYGQDDAWVDCFLPHASFELRSPDGLVRSFEGADELADFVARHTSAPEAVHKHMVAEPVITIDGDAADVVSYMYRLDDVDRERVVRAFGRYVDRLRSCPDGRWRFERRFVEIDTLAPTDLVLPATSA